MIQADSIYHQFGGKLVLKGPSLTVNPGEIVVIMGPNGMGKSTLLAAIGGALYPSRGTVTINGIERHSSPEAELQVRGQVMYLPDDPWVPSARTAREWAFGVGRLYTDNEMRLIEHIDALVSLFDLAPVANSPYSSYSAGQKKKAQLIAALAAPMPVLIFDEPFSGGLDPTGLYAIKEILRRRAAVQNTTILIATPTPELVEEVADRIIILRDGQITAEGTIEQLREQAGWDGNLAGLYERLSSSEIEARLSEYENEYLVRK